MPDKQKAIQGRERAGELPINKNEDVEFSAEAADTDDVEALQRARAADNRQQQ